MEKVLTVIVPAYNMEQYLRYCLDSLVEGGLREGLEVLVINDGSQDATSAIAHEYETAYPSIFKVVDKKNGNYGSCVKAGLAVARGKYVKILDADDSFEAAHFPRFLSFLSKVDADLVLSPFAVVDAGRNVRKVIRYPFKEGELLSFDQVCRSEDFKQMQMHAVTYRRDMLLAMDYRQTEGISYTDQEWIFLPMTEVRSMACFGEYVYKYLVGRPGQTVDPAVKLKSLSHTMRCALSMATAYEAILPRIAGRPVLEYLQARLLPFVKETYVYCLTHYSMEMRNMLADFDRELLRHSPEFYAYVGGKEQSSFCGFCYIAYWRDHQHASIAWVRAFSRLYLQLLKMRKKLSPAGGADLSLPANEK